MMKNSLNYSNISWRAELPTTIGIRRLGGFLHTLYPKFPEAFRGYLKLLWYRENLHNTFADTDIFQTMLKNAGRTADANMLISYISRYWEYCRGVKVLASLKDHLDSQETLQWRSAHMTLDVPLVLMSYQQDDREAFPQYDDIILVIKSRKVMLSDSEQRCWQLDCYSAYNPMLQGYRICILPQSKQREAMYLVAHTANLDTGNLYLKSLANSEHYLSDGIYYNISYDMLTSEPDIFGNIAYYLNIASRTVEQYRKTEIRERKAKAENNNTQTKAQSSKPTSIMHLAPLQTVKYTGTANKGTTHKSHKSPRMHERRSFVRRYKSGKTVLVSGAIVNGSKTGNTEILYECKK